MSIPFFCWELLICAGSIILLFLHLLSQLHVYTGKAEAAYLWKTNVIYLRHHAYMFKEWVTGNLFKWICIRLSSTCISAYYHACCVKFPCIDTEQWFFKDDPQIFRLQAGSFQPYQVGGIVYVTSLIIFKGREISSFLRTICLKCLQQPTAQIGALFWESWSSSGEHCSRLCFVTLCPTGLRAFLCNKCTKSRHTLLVETVAQQQL